MGRSRGEALGASTTPLGKNNIKKNYFGGGELYKILYHFSYKVPRP